MPITRLSALLLTLSLTVAAQSTGSQPTASIHAVVTDHGSQPIPDLPASSFTLQDNGRPVPLLSVRSGSAEPPRLVIVLDAVNSTFTQVSYQRDQLQRFLTADGGKLAYPTSIVIATDTAVQGTPGFTTDGNVLNKSLQQQTVALRELRRSSGFYGAQERLDISLRALRNVLAFAAATPGHKLVLVISPGWPLLSGPGVQLSGKDESSIYAEVESLSRQIQASNSTLYGIDPLGSAENLDREDYYQIYLKGISKPSQAQIANLGLQVLAVQSGGLALHGNNDIVAMLKQCAADAAAPYTLTFTPAPAEAGSEYHYLELRTSDSTLKVRTVTGLYLAAPQ